MLKLPTHIAMFIEHNAYASMDKSLKNYLDKYTSIGFIYHWKDTTAMARSLETNEVWTAQWYPETSIGFIACAAPTLEELIELINTPGLKK